MYWFQHYGLRRIVRAVKRWRRRRRRRRRRVRVEYQNLEGGEFRPGMVITNADGTFQGRIVSGHPDDDSGNTGTLVIEVIKEKP